jgi:hypothetical protein
MPMTLKFRRVAESALVAVAFSAAVPAAASTIAQNVSWTIDRPDSTAKFRVVAYGDSIFAGYHGSISSVAIWSAPNVDSEYASSKWTSDIEVIRRCKSGAKAKDIYNSKIVDDASYMEDASTRIVEFEMCGNDGLQARSSFRSQSGTCDYTPLQTALSHCTTYQSQAMTFINAHAAAGVEKKIISNLYYPGYDQDNQNADCIDSTTGTHPNLQDVFLPILLRMNWRACHTAETNGFACADTFAQFMGSDYDSNGDGKIDSRALRYKSGESEDAYVTRLGTTLRPTIRDANMHFVSATRSFDYIQSDDVHPTFEDGTIDLGPLGGSATGSGPPRFSDTRLAHGHNNIYRKFGHERMGWAISKFNPPAP